MKAKKLSCILAISGAIVSVNALATSDRDSYYTTYKYSYMSSSSPSASVLIGFGGTDCNGKGWGVNAGNFSIINATLVSKVKCNGTGTGINSTEIGLIGKGHEDHDGGEKKEPKHTTSK